MSEIRINHASLQQAAADIRATMNQIETRLDNLEKELAPLRSDWNGGQKDAYHQAKAKWDNAINEMKLLLNDTQRAVEESSMEFGRADARGAAKFGG